MSQITPLIYRTQSLQIYRDAIHSHCVDRMNGWYPKNDNEQRQQMVKIQRDQVKQEVLCETSVEDCKIKQEVIPSNVVVDVNDYNAMKIYYFEKALEGLKTEIPFVLKAQEEFAKNLKTTGISEQSIKALADLTKNLSPTTVTSSANGATVVTTPNKPEEKKVSENKAE